MTNSATVDGLARASAAMGGLTDPQPVPDTAPALDRLAALTGRPVPWTP